MCRNITLFVRLLAISCMFCTFARAADDEDSKGYTTPSREDSTKDAAADRKLASGMMKWLVGDSLSKLRPLVSQSAVVDKPSQSVSDQSDVAIRQIHEDQAGRFVGELIIGMFAAAFTGRVRPIYSAADNRAFQQRQIRKALDRDGFLVPKVARALTSIAGAPLLCVFITGPVTKGLPPVFVHPILDDERSAFDTSAHEFVIHWARVARDRTSRRPGLSTPGRWDFRPTVISTDGEVRVVYPAAMSNGIGDRPEAIPSCLRLIRFAHEEGALVPMSSK